MFRSSSFSRSPKKGTLSSDRKNGVEGVTGVQTCALPILAGTFGNCGRNTLRGPWRGNEDVSVIKLFQIAEKRNLEFRMEMFNAPNHVELSSPTSISWGGGSGAAPISTFGQITSTTTSMRQIQLALKFNF